MIEIRPTDPRLPAIQALLAASDAYAQSLYPAESNHLDPVDELIKPNAYFVGVYGAGNDDPVGCGAVKRLRDDDGLEYGEIKRMFVAPAARGLGAGRAVIAALEAHLRTHGVRIARLETGIYNHEALALYERCGYRRIGPFADYWDDPLSVFMEKHL
jgi:putative acetyltransferase